MSPPFISPQAVALAYLRRVANVSRDALGRPLGLTSKTIAEYESGSRRVSRKRVERLIAPLGFGPDTLEALMLEIAHFRGTTGSSEGSLPLPAEDLRAVAREGARLHQVICTELVRLRRAQRAQAARDDAAALLKELRALRSVAERRRAIETDGRFRTWALSIELAEEGVLAAPDSAEQALEWADLALRAALQVEAPTAFRSLLEGQVWSYIANARRVAGQQRKADAALARSAGLCQAGEGGDPEGLLPEWRRWEFEAGLRTAQGRFTEAFASFDRALTEAPRGIPFARLLLGRAHAWAQSGEPERALAVLEEASSELSAAPREPRLELSILFKRAVNLCHLDRFGEAADLLPGIRELAIEQRKALDMVRVVWLEGRVLAGLGQWEKGAAGLEQVRRSFTASAIDFDAALAALELAALELDRGDARAARLLAQDLAPLFDAQGVAAETIAALALFVEALGKEVATAAEAHRLLLLFLRAPDRHDPGEA
ncbi:MAG TPA: helix-turn-helix transcriptional regulator [Thermoanaerobaculia bacterium]|nr:helix-turn-helix transcriptional regulator [Thermoanaerobaculia bacterium]